MKRLVLLLLAVLLVLDLAHDGSLGKVKCVSPDSSVKVSHAAGKLNDLHFLKYAVWLGSPIQSRYQPLVHGTHQAIRIIDCCHRGSSGGIPL
jgi:hypothetical protein